MTPENAVEAAVIRPMLQSFPPPIHLRGDPRALQTALNVYRRALARFDRAALEQGWQKAASENEFCMWPKAVELVRACELFARRLQPPAQGWVEEATALTGAYAKRFMQTSQTAVRAREGGYEQALQRYVREAAWVQSQYVLGREGVGYSSLLFDHLESKERRAGITNFLAKAREQAAKGHIRVHVPAELLWQWREQATSVGRER